jgi:tape measure domain-containing protein
MATSEIVIKLELDDKNFRGSISGAGSDIRRFKKSVKSSSRAVEEAEDRQRSWGKSLRDTVIVVGLAEQAIQTLSAAIFGLPVAIVKSNAELERLQALLAGLSTESGGLAEAQQDAAETMEYLFETAKRTPFAVNALTDSFVKMKAVGLDPMGGIFEGLVNSVAKFGGTPEMLKRASIAIQQMAGKGVISMEELRQQLGEAVPDAMQIMARSMGISMGELVDQVSTGTVEAKNALAAMARQMNIENGGAALRMSETWDGMINRMKTSLTLAAKEIGDAGFFDEVKGQLQFIVDDLLQDPRFFNFMRDLGGVMTNIVSGMSTAAGAIYEFRGAIADAGVALIALFVTAKTQKNWDGITRFGGGIKRTFLGMGASIKATRLELRATRFYINAAAVSMGNFSNATRISTIALSQFSIIAARAKTAIVSLFTAIGGWSTVLLLGIPLLILALKDMGDTAYDAAKKIDLNQPQFITSEQLEAMKIAKQRMQELRDQEAEIEEKKAQKAAEIPNRGYFTRYDAMGVGSLEREGVSNQREQESIKNEVMGKRTMAEFENAQLAAQEALRRTALASFRKTTELAIQGDLREQKQQYKEDIDALQKQSSEMTAKEYRDARVAREKVLEDQTRESIDNQIKIAKDGLKKMQANRDENTQEEIETQKAKIEQIKRLREDALSVFDGSVYDIELLKGGESEGKKQLSELEKLLQSRQKMLDKYNAKGKGENPYLAELNGMIEAGRFAESTAKELENARNMMTELWQARQKWEKQNAEGKAFADALKDVDQIAGKINSKFKDRANQNPLMQDILQAEKLKGSLGEVRAEIMALSSISVSDKVSALKRLNQLSESVTEKAKQATVKQLGAMTDAINTSLLPEMQKIENKYHALRQQAFAWRAEQDKLTPDQLIAFNNYLTALNKKMAKEMQTPVEQLLEQWADGTAQMQNLWTNTMQSFVDTLTDGLLEGKLQLNDFVKEFARMLIKIQIQKAAAGIATGLGSLFSGGANSFASQTPGPPTAPNRIVELANGGIMTPKGKASLETYANGGIANSPQLALYGEGRQPEAYVPLPDGRTIPVTVSSDDKQQRSAPMQGGDTTVNVINQTGQPMEAESGQPRFDGKQMILDVVLSAVNQPGGFRNGMKSALKK